MSALELDLSTGKKPAQVQENLIAYMRIFAGLPNMLMRDDQIFWFISHKGAPGNNILKVCWTEDRVEEHIDALFDAIRPHIDEISWMVFPGDQPADLNQRLEARGMPGGRAGNWLWADLSDPAAPGLDPGLPEAFHIQRVSDDHQMAVWTRASEDGFGGQPGDLQDFYTAYARHGYGPNAFSLHYIGYLGDIPVTSGTLLDAGGSASIYDVSTLPAYRRSGLGRGLMRFMLREIRARGYRDTWIWSSNTAQSLYRSLGYVDADFGVREHIWQQSVT